MVRRMVQIFVSHSQYDKDILASFDKVFARTSVASKCMEYEKMHSPQWQDIRNAVTTSETVFLWVAFEVGLACAFGKEVWVFEQGSSFVEFPIPYLTDYMIYNLEDQEHFNYVRSIIEGYGKPLYIFPLGVDHRTKRNIPQGIYVDCNHCHAKYALHTNVTSFCCPSCRQQLFLQEK